jgi:diguanylate cyclase (GGDEF)-like protein
MPDGQQQEPRWNALFRASRAWGAEWSVEQLLLRITRDVIELTGLNRALLFLLEPSGLVNRASWPVLDSEEPSRALDASRNVAQQVVNSGRPIYAHHLNQQDPAGGTVRNICCVPLTANRGILGALYLDSREKQDLNQQDQEFLEMLALQAAVALEHAIVYQSAITDPLTGLFSHRHFQQEIEQSIRRAIRSEQPLSLVILDLDHFKELNDTAGHAVGNECLTRVAALLRASLRATDVLARFGGDEFELLLPETPGEAALSVAEKIRSRIADLSVGSAVKVTATIGVASYSDNACNGASLFLRADEALYKAKEAGRNCVRRSSFVEKDAPAPSGLRSSPKLIAVAAEQSKSSDSQRRPAPVSLDNVIKEYIDGHLLVKRLGTGSNGEVLLVRQPDLDREVALKRPLTPHLTAEQIRAFEQQAKVTASLNHPGVITVYTMGRDVDGRRYYTMRPLEGESLAFILSGRRKGDAGILKSYSLRRLLEIIQRASETLAYAHRQNVAHLDISPSNILVGNFGEVTIIDWGNGPGSSVVIERSNGSDDLKFLVGSPAYMAPEAIPASGKLPGPPTDVFSLGAILYEILTGQAPYVKGTMRQTLEALVKGDLVPPHKISRDVAVDPALEELCRLSLHPDPAARPTALDFAERIGRHVRRETNWIVKRFDQKIPLVESDWEIVRGNWSVENNEWVSRGNAENWEGVLLWKTVVPGSFKMIIDCWQSSSDELSLFGHASVSKNVLNFGYTFQFGCECGAMTKLCRQLSAISAAPGLAPERRKHYRLELCYDDAEGRLRTFIDGKQIFDYHELFLFPGDRLGFYSWGSESHFKPVEIWHEAWALEIPVIRLADSLYGAKNYEAALQKYTELWQFAPDRNEGIEARLKIGMCLAQLGRYDEARAIFHSLHGSILEPFAIAEEARMDWAGMGAASRPRHSLALFRALLEKHPQSHAKIAINDIPNYSNVLYETLSDRTEVEEIISELALLGRGLCVPPTVCEVTRHTERMRALMELGRWQCALDDALAFDRTVLPRSRTFHQYEPFLLSAMISCGRDDLLPADPHSVVEWLPHGFISSTGVIVHILARKYSVEKFLTEEDLQRHLKMERAHERHHTLATAYLMAHRPNDALKVVYGSPEMKKQTGNVPWVYFFGSMLISAQLDGELQDFLSKCPDLFPCHPNDVLRLRARQAIETRDFERAAELLQQDRSDCKSLGTGERTVLLALLGGLNLLNDFWRANLGELIRYNTTGTRRELCEMLLGQREPKLGALWPHACWNPEWRLWLGLWLEARGNRQAAADTVRPALDPRYGLTNCQPAIAALLKRTAQ